MNWENEKNIKKELVKNFDYIPSNSVANRNEEYIYSTIISKIEIALEGENEYDVTYFKELKDRISELDDEIYDLLCHNFPYTSFVEFILKSGNQQIINECIKIIAILSNTEDKNFKSLETNEFVDILFELFADGNEDIYDDIMHIIACMCCRNINYTQIFLDKGLMNILVQIPPSSYSVNILSCILKLHPQLEEIIVKVYVEYLECGDIDPTFESLRQLLRSFVSTESEDIKEFIKGSILNCALKLISFDDDETTTCLFEFLSLCSSETELPKEILSFIMQKLSHFVNNISQVNEHCDLIRTSALVLTKQRENIQDECVVVDIREKMKMLTGVEALDFRSYTCCFVCYLLYFDFENDLDDEMLTKMVQNAENHAIAGYCFKILLNVYQNTNREDVFEALKSLESVASVLAEDQFAYVRESAEEFLDIMAHLDPI